jgi:hypothetical protein
MTRKEFNLRWGDRGSGYELNKLYSDELDQLIAAEREEQREACANAAYQNGTYPDTQAYRRVLAEPLTATPLATQIAELEREVQRWRADAEAIIAQLPPDAVVRVREGGGLEELRATLAVSVSAALRRPR